MAALLTRAPTPPCLQAWTCRELAHGAFQPHANAVPIPDGPGLGVTIDLQALARAKQRYERDGVISQLGVPGEVHYRQFLQQ